MRSAAAALLLALVPNFSFAQNNAIVPDPDPELERKTFIVAPGFEVNLFAADPLLAKPIQMNFDPQGRLWVASSEIYPQIKPGEKANDKILYLEDLDGDGKADKTTVFADGLLIPTGVAPGDGGAYVANSTEVVHLSASKPGSKADKKRIVLSGFGTEDTHHIIHTFRWGPDGCLYFNQSIYIHSHIETPWGVKRLNAGGIWRFNTEKTELDVFARGWVNTWGHSFDRFGQSFVTDGAGGEGINHVVPGGYYMTSVGPHTSRILHGLNPGSPKFCGLDIVSGRHFPDEWQGDLITNDFRGHRVCRFKLQDDGSTFSSREQVEVIKSNHPAFRPIDVKMGPDGALYIADWYNPIIQHGEVDFRDPRRDKTHGRIWRVTAKGRPLVPRPKLAEATVAELLERLKDPEDWTRQQAKQVLRERDPKAVFSELVKWTQNLDSKNGDYEHRLLEAARVHQSLGALHPTVKPIIAAKDPRVRAAAVRIMKNQTGEFYPTVDQWQKLVLDENPRVRVEAIRALSERRESSSAEIALTALNLPLDRNLDYALWLTVRELEPYWMPEFKAGKLTFGGDAKRLAFALSAVGTQDAIKPVVALLDSGKVQKENLHAVWLLLARIGGPEELRRVLDRADRGEDVLPLERVALVQAVEDSVRTRKIGRPRDLNLFHLVDEINNGTKPESRAASRSACRLIGLWKDEDSRQVVENIARSTREIATDDRIAALEAIALFGDARARILLTSLCGSESKPELRRLAIIALVGIDTPSAANLASEFLVSTEPGDELSDLYAAFLNRKGGAVILAKALEGKKLKPDVAKLGLRAVRASVAQDAAPLSDALTKSGGLGVAKKEPTPDEVRGLVADLLKIGDPVRGENVFRRKDLQCLACHGVGGAGGQVGPDLTSIGASAQPDYLVESLLMPNKAVKEGYHAIRIVTLDDKVYLGIKIREGNGELVIRTPEDKEITIPLKDIAERGNTRSIMPDGITDTLTRQEFTDLTRFLSELGKLGPYAPSKSRVVRRWQIIEPLPSNMDLARRTRLAAAADPGTPFSWSPVYSRVSGDLPLSDLPKIVVWNDTAPLAVVRFQLDVTTAGSILLKFNSVQGLSLYSGSTPVEVKPNTSLNLPVGVHTFTIMIDRSKRTDDLRVELDDIPNSTARVSVVGGK